MFRRPASIKLATVAGIRIGVDATWFLMLFLMIFLLSGSFRNALHASDGVAYLTTVVTVLLFFCSLIVHELGHAIVARRRGITVNRIELFLFGGMTSMSREAATPGEEFQIAIAGPLATLLFTIPCLAVDFLIVGSHRLLHAVVLDGTVAITPVLLALSWLLLMNLLILVFNLIPAYPLDGGRIARAVVWRITGDRLRGTRVAASVGRGFAILLGGFGIWLFLEHRSFEGIWLVMLAFLLHQSARATLAQNAMSERMRSVRVTDVMDHEPVAVPQQTPVAQALDEYFRRYGASWLPVIDAAGHFMGIARRERIETAAASESWLTVGSVLEADEASALRVDQDEPLAECLSREALGRLGAVVAVDPEGVLRGVVTQEQVSRALQAVLGPPAPRPLG
jgi:Zn-dependent protease